ncbi:MAG: SMI1/KNR4 family protein [Oscillospiraceae bacterium]|nr:SMI1/KNR4 family protein [Oscillospiraceae bacterium]
MCIARRITIKLSDIERQFEVTFPNGFHKIYDTGAMEWAELLPDEFRKIREKYDNDPNSFMMMNGEVEPLFFEEIPERAEELAEWLSWRAEDTGETLRDGIKLVPFAQNGAGDLYLFVYKGKTEPKIVLFYHDDFESPSFGFKDFDELMYYALLDALRWDEDINGKTWQNHLDYLTDEYRAKITSKSKEELLDDFEELERELVKNVPALF